MIKAKRITAKNFSLYGWVIEYPDQNSKDRRKNLFRIVVKEKRPLGWRIAYLVVREKNAIRMETHPESLESFEPVSGKSLIYTAAGRSPEKIECFYLDKPVVLKKGIWHAVVTTGRESEIKITENASVTTRYCRIAK